MTSDVCELSMPSSSATLPGKEPRQYRSARLGTSRMDRPASMRSSSAATISRPPPATGFAILHHAAAEPVVDRLGTVSVKCFLETDQRADREKR